MNKHELGELVDYVAKQGTLAILENTDEQNVSIDYVAIFAKDTDEFENMLCCAESLGSEVDKKMLKTGHTFLLREPLETTAGNVSYLKIRKPDPTRTQRGAPDFTIPNYQEFKKKYLKSSGNFTLMVREDYEMIELKGIDVLVYIKNKPFEDSIGKSA